jgi:hypothetical protein
MFPLGFKGSKRELRWANSHPGRDERLTFIEGKVISQVV